MTHIRYLNVLCKSCWFTSQHSDIYTSSQASGGKFCVVWKFRLLTKNYCILSGNSPSAIVLCSTLQSLRAASQSSSETVWHFAVICDCCDDSSSFPHNIGNFTTDDEEALKIDYLLLSLGTSLSIICAQEWITSSRRILWYSWHRRCDLTINLDFFDSDSEFNCLVFLSLQTLQFESENSGGRSEKWWEVSSLQSFENFRTVKLYIELKSCKRVRDFSD